LFEDAEARVGSEMMDADHHGVFRADGCFVLPVEDGWKARRERLLSARDE
jgi:hypothetical protein